MENRHFKRQPKVIILIFIAPIIIGIVAAIAYPIFSEKFDLGLCSTDPIYSQVSPTAKMRVVGFYYDCGATTGYSTQVSILPVNEPINDSGNVLVTDGKNQIGLKWLSDKELLIEDTKELKVYKKLHKYNGVTIVYR